jgi:hypothetical protein
VSRLDSLGIAKQTGLGAKATVMEYYVPIGSSNADLQRDTITYEETLGNPFPTGLDYGVRWWQVPHEGAARRSSLPRLLSAYLGLPTSSVLGSGVSQHVFDPTVTTGGVNEVQTLAITGAPTGGTFTITFRGQITAAIPFNATAAQVQAALEALSTIGVGGVAVSGGPLPGSSVVLTFQNQLGNQDVPLITTTNTFTGGASPNTTVTPTTAGVFPKGVPVPHSILLNRADPAPNITDLVFDALGNEFTLACETNGFVMLNGTLIALDNDDTQPAPSPTSDFSPRWTFDQVTLVMSVGGAASVPCVLRNFSFNYNNNLDTDQAVLGQRKLYTVAPENRDAQISFSTRDANLLSHYRRALKDDPDSVKLTFTIRGPLIGGGFFQDIVLTTYVAEYTEAPAPLSAGDRLKAIDVVARCRYDDVAGKFVTLAVNNTVAGY